MALGGPQLEMDDPTETFLAQEKSRGRREATPAARKVLEAEDKKRWEAQAARRDRAAMEEKAAAVRERLGGGQQGQKMPEGYVPGGPVDVMGGMMQQREQDIEDVRARLRRTVSAPNIMYGPTGEHIERTRRALGAEVQATRNLEAANVLRERRAVEEGQSQIRETATQMAVDRATEGMRIEEQRQAMEAQKVIQGKIAEAADRISEAPDIDPDRFWASRSAGQKFAFILSAGLLGAAGKSEVAFGNLQNAIQSDIDAQKATFQQRRAALGARREELESERGVYASLVDTLGDERAADLAFENARLEQGRRKMQQLMAESGVPVMTAEGQQLLARMDQRMSENQFMLDKMAASNPRRIVRSAVGGEERRQLLEQEKTLMASGAGVEKAMLGELGKTSEFTQKAAQEHRKEIDKKKQWITQQRGGEKARYDVKLEYEIQQFKKDVAEKGGIKGLGGGAWWGSQHWTALKRIKEYLGRSQSGARIADDELENFAKMVEGRLTEEQTMQNLDDLLDTTQHVLQDIRRGAGDEAYAEWAGIPLDQLPPLPPYEERAGGGGGLRTIEPGP